MKLHRLPPEVIVRLRSGIAITSVSHCVDELVTNSIDAGASCIAVRLNLPYFKIQVIDNGEGIPFDQMDWLGERYATSKCSSLEDLENLKSGGFRGEALSSLKDISNVMIVESRHKLSRGTYLKIYNQGKADKSQKSTSGRASCGTTVTVHDFMYNMPVRKLGISEALDLEDCRRTLEKIALMYPGVSFSLRSDATGEICLETKKSHSLSMSFTFLYGRERSQHLKEVSLSDGNLGVLGVISTEGHMTKDMQLFFVNKRYLSRCKLHKLVDSMLNKVLFTRQKGSLKEQKSFNIDSPSKCRYGIFVLNVSCPYNQIDITFEPRKTAVVFLEEDKVLNLIEKTVFGFFESNSLLPTTVTDLRNDLKSIGTVNSVSDDGTVFPGNVGKDINPTNLNQVLISLPAKRSRENKEANVKKTCLNIFAEKKAATNLVEKRHLRPPEISADTSGCVASTPEGHGKLSQVSVEKMKKLLAICSEDEKSTNAEKNGHCTTVSTSVDLSNDTNTKSFGFFLREQFQFTRTQTSRTLGKHDECPKDVPRCKQVSRFKFGDTSISKGRSQVPCKKECRIKGESQDLSSEINQKNVKGSLSDCRVSGGSQDILSKKLYLRKLSMFADSSDAAFVEPTLKVLKAGIQKSTYFGLTEELVSKNEVAKFDHRRKPSHFSILNLNRKKRNEDTNIANPSYDFLPGRFVSELGIPFKSERSSSPIIDQHSRNSVSNSSAVKQERNQSINKRKTRFTCSFVNKLIRCDAVERRISGVTREASTKEVFNVGITAERKIISKHRYVRKEGFHHSKKNCSTSLRNIDSSDCVICEDASESLIPSKFRKTIRHMRTDKPKREKRNFSKLKDLHPVFQNMLKKKVPNTSDSLCSSLCNHGSVISDEGSISRCDSVPPTSLSNPVSNCFTYKTIALENDNHSENNSETNVQYSCDIPKDMNSSALHYGSSEDGGPSSEDKLKDNNCFKEVLTSSETGITVQDDIICDNVAMGKRTTNQQVGGNANPERLEVFLDKENDSHKRSPDQQKSTWLNSDKDDDNCKDNSMPLSNQVLHVGSIDKCQDLPDTTDCQEVVQKNEPLENERYVAQTDPETKRTIFIDRITGNSSYDSVPNLCNANSKDIKVPAGQSHFFLTHDASPFMARPLALRQRGTASDFVPSEVQVYVDSLEDLDAKVKWNGSQPNVENTKVEDLFSTWENPVFTRAPSEVDLNPNVTTTANQKMMHSVMNMHRFSKKAFSNIKVIGQVDKKFIACILCNINESQTGKQLLVLFDQHAVHERVRLEQLMEDMYDTNDSGKKIVKSFAVCPPICVTMSSCSSRLLRSFADHLSQFGIALSPCEDSNLFEVHSLPRCIIDRLTNELKRKRDFDSAGFVENLIQEWLMLLEQTRGVTSLLPKTLTNVLNSQACRGAVKFGDALEFEECVNLINSLSSCNLPFQCAHGRPSLAPMLDIRKVNCLGKKPKPQLWKLPLLESEDCG